MRRKQLCVEYTTRACKSTYCVRIVRLFRVSDLLRTYTTCALEATCVYDVHLVRVSDLLRTYSTAFARKATYALEATCAYAVQLLRVKRLKAYVIVRILHVK